LDLVVIAEEDRAVSGDLQSEVQRQVAIQPEVNKAERRAVLAGASG
jgi:hypothetical protein